MGEEEGNTEEESEILKVYAWEEKVERRRRS